jgi:hypothetical protein
MWRKVKEFTVGAGGWAVASELASLVFFLMSIVSASRYTAFLSAYVFLVISVPLFWIGAFIAWNKKATELDAEKSRNAKPEIVGRIVLAIVRITGSGRDEDGVVSHNCTIAMKLSITSKTNVDATLKDADLLVRLNGYEYVGKRLPLHKWEVYQSHHGGAKPEQMNDLISSITYSNPIRYRVASEGWLEFLVNGPDVSLNTGPLQADLKVTFVDDLEDKHVIIAEDVLIRS